MSEQGKVLVRPTDFGAARGDAVVQKELLREELKHERSIKAELLAACKALQMEAAARGCGLRIADEAIAKAESRS